MACHRVNCGMAKRIGALERQSQSQPIEQPFELAEHDAEFFEHMLARALAGDRDWTAADQARYHAILLGETDY